MSGCQPGIVVACQPECESEYEMYRTSSTAASDTPSQSESGKLRVLTRSRGPRIYMIPGHGIERGQAGTRSAMVSHDELSDGASAPSRTQPEPEAASARPLAVAHPSLSSPGHTKPSLTGM